MKKHFPGFYPLGETHFEELLNRATIVLDVDVLLDLFRMHPDDAHCFLSLLNDKHIKNKLWMPYDVAWLYHKRVNEEIQKQIDNVNSVLSHLSSCKNAIQECKRFPYLDDRLTHDLQFVTHRIEEVCKGTANFLSKRLRQCDIKDTLQSLFREGKVGNEYESSELEEIYCEGLVRYRNNEPPGYESEVAKEDRIRYHDFIIWKQMLAYASNQRNRGIFFVTGRVRTDWYYVVNGETISTRHELINEFLKELNAKEDDPDAFFYCISSKQFVELLALKGIVHIRMPHLKDALQEEIVYASLNADGMLNNQTENQSSHE